ncbi:pyridoxamine 5'-phosphate oxidase family protein [Streptomyces armeniacus]|uniref:Pyridoxamine 5'-phosphate oxidase family protein n=1 Tax=Streptomyces armeniacus TaxID=83291 RepID=A0A345XSH7_9ACTN|nr:pyridoxamine 5'-phosphate oxidase family protein [Streptomyces armeniacus]AXK34593.1 pyridoxamine 5'-phosphate oxidase family protein [Streptomyces armeniacus]
MSREEILRNRARGVVDANKYMALGTADETGSPWVSPVYFTPDSYSDFYWVSSPEARHSLNIAGRPEVSIVIFDSSVPIGSAEAVYVTALAEEVPVRELERCAEVYGVRLPEARRIAPDELRAPADLRLYRASATDQSLLIRGGDPDFGRGVDSRLPVTLTG